MASVLLPLLVAGCAASKPAFLHPQFPARIGKLSRLEVVLQTPAEIGLMHYRGNVEPFTNQSALVSDRLPDLIAAQLQQRGFVLVSPSGVEQVDAKVRAQAQGWMEKWHKTGKCGLTTNGQSEVSQEAKLLAAQAQADGVVLVRCWGKQNTSARQFREGVIVTFGVLGAIAGTPGGEGGAALGGIVVGGTAWLVTGAGKLGEFGNHATLEVILLDGTTGEALWAATHRHDFIGPALDQLAAGAFRSFPLKPSESAEWPAPSPFGRSGR